MMIRRRPPTSAPSCSQLPSASSPLSVTSGAHVRVPRNLVLACQGRQSLASKQPASLLPQWQTRYSSKSHHDDHDTSKSSSAPITAKGNHQRQLVKLHLGPSTLAPTAPAAVTNSRLRQGALYARRHQLPAPADASRQQQQQQQQPTPPPRHQLHHLQACASTTGRGSLASNQQRHIRASTALAREISALAATASKSSSVTCCLIKTKSCLPQSKEQKKSSNPVTKTTRLAALTIGGAGVRCGAKTASQISLNSSTSSLTLAVVKRARQASAALTKTTGATASSHSQRRNRIHQQQTQLARLKSSPSVASSGYQSRASTSASRSNSSSAGSSAGDVQTDGAAVASTNSSARPDTIAPNRAASDNNSASAAAVERTATEPPANGQKQNQNNNSIEPNIVAPKPKSKSISTNHQSASTGETVSNKQATPVASLPVSTQRNVEEEEEEEEDFQDDYYHHKTMIISSSPSELDYGDSEEEGQAVKPPPPPSNAQLQAMKQPPPEIPIRTDLIGDHYDLEARPFARGKFAQVKRCVHKKSKQSFAAKCIKKRRRLADTRNEILLEISALKLSYYTERIVKLYEVYETPSEIIFVLEMAKGGELQRVIDDEELIDEHLVRRMVKQILEGLIQLHDNDIAHLDIKPQNLLLTEPFPNGDILLCDFGISRRITKDCEIRDICGTPDYVAPEILSYDPISLATDMWSLGVLTYVLLSGYSPFGSDNKQQTFCNITQAVLDFPSEIFDKISKEAIDFMQKLILREPTERLTSRQARQHPWLTGGTSNC